MDDWEWDTRRLGMTATKKADAMETDDMMDSTDTIGATTT
jgi:hypothetical protein